MSSSPSSFLAQCLRAWILGHYFHKLLESGSHFCSDWAVVPVVVQRQCFMVQTVACAEISGVSASAGSWAMLWRPLSFNDRCVGPGNAEICGVSTGAVLGQCCCLPRCVQDKRFVQTAQKTEFPQVAFLGQGVACPLLCMPEVMVCRSDVEQIVASCHR